MSVDKVSTIKARLLSEDILLKCLIKWAESNGFAAYEKSEIRGDKNKRKVGQFYWDVVAPCYLRPLINKEKKIVPAFFVCDVNLKFKISEDQCHYFIKKVEMYENTSHSGKLFPIYIAESFDKEAFKLGKKMGIILTTPKNLFGKEFAKNLEELSKLMQSVFEKFDEKDVYKLAIKMIKYYDNFSNLRGFTFECITAYITMLDEPGNSLLRKIIKVGKEKREIDVFKTTIKEESLTFIECKAKENSYVSEEEVKKWIETTKLINEWLKEPEQHIYKDSNIKFQMWTNTDFMENAKEMLNKKNKESKKREYTFKNCEDILNIISGTNFKYKEKGVSDSFKSFFMKKV